jgi:hypothetical protein
MCLFVFPLYGNHFCVIFSFEADCTLLPCAASRFTELVVDFITTIQRLLW